MSWSLQPPGTDAVVPIDVNADFKWNDGMYSSSSTDSSDSDELLEFDFFAQEQDHGRDSGLLFVPQRAVTHPPWVVPAAHGCPAIELPRCHAAKLPSCPAVGSLPDDVDSFDDPSHACYLDTQVDARPWQKSNPGAPAEQVGNLHDLADLADCRAQQRRRLVASAISMTAAHCKFEQICPPVVVELPATDHVSNSVTMMADGWPMDGAVRSHNKRKRRSPKGARVRVSKGKGAPRSRRGGGAMRDKEPSKKKPAATAWHASFESNESSSAQEVDTMGEGPAR